MNRALLVRLHRYAGLLMAAFLTVAGLTGAVIAFEAELDAWLNPAVMRVAPGRPALSPSALVAAVERGDPRLQVTRLEPGEEDGRAAMVLVRPRLDPASGKPFEPGFNQMFVDPADGRVTGVRNWGEFGLDRLRLVPFLYRLHFTLALPNPWGRWLMGGIALLWLLDCVNGLCLTLPRRGAPFWAGWKPAWVVRWGARGWKLHFDLHRAVSLWLWGLLLILAFTSMALNLRHEVFNPLVGLFSPLAEARLATRPPLAVPTPSFDQVVETARADARARGEDDALRRVSYHPGQGFFLVRLESRSYVLAGQDGAVLGTQALGEGSAGDVLSQLMFPLHSGQVAGLPGRVLVAVCGLAVCLLSVTGLVIWWTKRRARRRAATG